MSVLIAIPVFRVGCRVGIDRGRAWSVVDELVLWAMTRQSKSIASLALEADLPPQVIIASVARLMRFRLVEVTLGEGSVAFRASAFGFKAVSSGNPLPFYPKRVSRRVSFVIEWATGDFFPTRQIRLMTPQKLEDARRSGVEVRVVLVDGGGPSISHNANLNRLSEVENALGWGDHDLIAGKRKVNLVFNFIDHFEAIATDLADRKGRCRSLLTGTLWRRDKRGSVTLFRPGLIEEHFATVFSKLPVATLFERIRAAARDEFPDDYLGMSFPPMETETRRRSTWLKTCIYEAARADVGEGAAGTLSRAVTELREPGLVDGLSPMRDHSYGHYTLPWNATVRTMNLHLRDLIVAAAPSPPAHQALTA